MLAAVQQRMDMDTEADHNLELAGRLLTTAYSGGVRIPDMPYSRAALLAMSGQVDAGMDMLEQAFDEGFRRLWLLRVDFRLDALRTSDRFADFIQRLEAAIEAERKSLPEELLTMKAST
jgi:hypothetical protein